MVVLGLLVSLRRRESIGKGDGSGFDLIATEETRTEHGVQGMPERRRVGVVGIEKVVDALDDCRKDIEKILFSLSGFMVFLLPLFAGGS
jgi:hypothetical protein